MLFCCGCLMDNLKRHVSSRKKSKCPCLSSLIALQMCWSCCFLQPISATTYYIDAVDGSDNNSGINPARPWKTLGKVNSMTFAPGDRILFAAGRRWNGKLHPKGSGTVGNPIVIGRYGDGALPVIDGAGSTGDGVVYLYNQKYWEITNLEITNDAPTGADRQLRDHSSYPP
jgi:hypothetical protein